MSALVSSNPVLNEKAFSPASVWGNFGEPVDRTKTMTVRGAAVTTAILLGVVAATAIAVWQLLAGTPWVFAAAIGGSLLGCILTMVICFKQQWSPFLAWPIALCEGAMVGGMSLFWASYVEGRIAAHAGGTVTALGTGLIIQAVMLTVGVAAGVLMLNMSNVLRATPKFVMIVGGATMGLCLFSMVTWILSMFGIRIPYLWDNGIIGIGFALFVVVLAALNLVMNFDMIRNGADNRLPKYMEWYSAIGLLVTLVWLYLSILRLLAMLNRRD